MEYSCNICNKSYKTYQTLWKHNKNFHNTKSSFFPQNPQILPQNPQILPQNIPKLCNCIYCNKEFSRKDNLKRHELKCKTKNNQDTLKEKELELQIKKEEAAILRLKLKLQNSDKIENITLRKLNKLLKVHNTRIKNSTVNSHNNIQNNNYITNNFQLIGFGKEEDLQQILTNKEKKMIINAKFCALDKLIEIVHCGKYNQFKNIILTNMKDNYIYKYDLHPIEFA
jgi:hypothetical protein